MFVKILSVALFCVQVCAPAWADSMRCKNDLVKTGTSSAELIQKCGQPVLKEDLVRVGGNRVGANKMEKYGTRWTYDLGKNEFMRLVTLENGQIVQIELGPRGH